MTRTNPRPSRSVHCRGAVPGSRHGFGSRWITRESSGLRGIRQPAGIRARHGSFDRPRLRGAHRRCRYACPHGASRVSRGGGRRDGTRFGGRCAARRRRPGGGIGSEVCGLRAAATGNRAGRHHAAAALLPRGPIHRAPDTRRHWHGVGNLGGLPRRANDLRPASQRWRNVRSRTDAGPGALGSGAQIGPRRHDRCAPVGRAPRMGAHAGARGDRRRLGCCLPYVA